MFNVDSVAATGARIRRVRAVSATLVVLDLIVGGLAFAQNHATEGVLGLATASGVRTGDVDGDGRLDLVTITTAGDLQRFETYFGDGFSFAGGVASPIGGNEAKGLALGDLDGDGDLDVVASSFVSGLWQSPLLVFGRGDATGVFSAQIGGPVTFSESELADLDLDGDLDLVAATSGSIFHMRNQGNGTLTFGNSDSHHSLGGGILRLAVRDFDGDGDPDVACMSSNGPVLLARNTITSGVATLADLQTILNASALDFAAFDLHGDGDFDLAATGTTALNELMIAEARAGGDFVTGALVPGAVGSSFVVGADVDLDGRSDLVTERQVHRSLGSGLPILDSSHLLPHTERAIVADFNSDQRPDLLLVGSPWPFPTTWSYDAAPFPLAIGELVLNDGAGRFPSRLGSPSPTIRGGFAIDHYDSDGDLDLLALAWDAGTSKFLARIVAGDGAGSFADNPGSNADVTAQLTLLAPPAIAVDLDGNGLRDLLVADSNATVASPRLQAFLANGVGGLSPGVSTSVPFSTILLHAGFIDADLHIDAVMERITGSISEYRVAFGDGLGGFTPAAQVLVSPGPAPFTIPEPTAVADVTGDGLGDLIVRIAALGPIRVWRGLGDGGFVFHSDTPWTNDGVFTVAELTGDTAADLVLLELVDSKLRLEIRPGTGAGTFLAGSSVQSPGISDLLGVEVVDFDGDGDRDVVGFGADSGHFVAFPNLGSAGFGAASGHRVGPSAAGYPIRKGPLFGDVDGDGRLDVVGVTAKAAYHDEIVVLPGACDGRTVGYGHGCPGSGGFTPRLAIVGTPCSGNSVGVELRDGLGGSVALVFLGGGEGVVPISSGCKLLIAPLFPISFAVPLAGVGPGAGSFAIPTLIPSTIAGVTLTMQVFVADPSVIAGASGTAGLAVRFGD